MRALPPLSSLLKPARTGGKGISLVSPAIVHRIGSTRKFAANSSLGAYHKDVERGVQAMGVVSSEGHSHAMTLGFAGPMVMSNIPTETRPLSPGDARHSLGVNSIPTDAAITHVWFWMS